MMKLRFRKKQVGAVVALATSLLVNRAGLLAADGQVQATAQARDEADSFFGLTNVWTLHLKVSAEDWAKMEPEMPQRFGRPGDGPPPDFDGPPGEGPRGADSPGPRPANVGGNGPRTFMQQMPQLDYPMVPATLEFEGRTLEKVGLRFKGNSSYMSSQRSLKRPFKIDFNEYVKSQRLFGLTKLSLNNGAMDFSFMREVLAYEVFRQLGVPAPRTAYGKVFITVPGKHNREYAGIYTLVENVDDGFLKRHFGTKKGLLLKPEARGGLTYFGESWDAYKKAYDPKSEEVLADDAQRFIAFTKLVNRSDEETFRAQIGSFMDVDEFLRFLAGNAATANLDSFLSMGHNYYLSMPAKTRKITWIPWDLNEAFGRFMMGGTPEQQIDLSIDHPHAGENRLIERVLAVPEYKRAYRKYLEQIAASFRDGKTRADFDALLPVLSPIIAQEPRVTVEQFEASVFRASTNRIGARFESPIPGDPPRGERGPGAFGPRRPIGPPLKTWLTQRAESITEQLAGKREGQRPRSGRPGGPAGPDGGGGFEPRLERGAPPGVPPRE